MERVLRTRKRTPKVKMNKTQQRTYSLDDYNSGDGMLTTVWGPGKWHFLHTMSFNYPVNPTPLQKKQYRDYILSLKHVLPCGKCRKNLAKNLKKLPIQMKHMQSRETFSKYIYDLHELVNGMLGKTSGLTYDDVRERYEHFRSRCTETEPQPKVENGCTQPLYGEKSRCILKIVPSTTKCETMQIDKKCIKHRITSPE
jgi:hypothetical protein